jgi:cysteine synthase
MNYTDPIFQRFREKNIVLPTFSELENPHTIPDNIIKELDNIGPDDVHPLNLFRIHWYNDASRSSLVNVPEYIILPESLTGVKAPILVVLGKNFPMIKAHKVLAAYGCLAPRLVNREFDPTNNKALWPSTGNYCRGGVAVSRIMGCRGMAILPEKMSKERFEWLEEWVSDPSDIVRTEGSESNVKEIYDKCAELRRDPKNVIFNQFCEFGNVHVHYSVSGKAFGEVFKDYKKDKDSSIELFAYVAATGSAGTLSAGDRLKDDYGCSKIACVEAVECPTLLYNGFGEHNIQGIGDKHVPYIHNVMNTDFVIGVSEDATNTLMYLFNHEKGKEYLHNHRNVPMETIEQLAFLGYSGIGNILAAIKLAKYHNLNENQAIITVATDSGEMYKSDYSMIEEKYFNSNSSEKFNEINAAEIYGQYILGLGIEHLQELSYYDKKRIFNLGYYTWVEQQNMPLDEFNKRADPTFWKNMRGEIKEWDKKICKFNKLVKLENGFKF